ncbi:MAG: hypothetical protein AAF627_18350 [Myxococcota bacterium]
MKSFPFLGLCLALSGSFGLSCSEPTDSTSSHDAKSPPEALAQKAEKKATVGHHDEKDSAHAAKAGLHAHMQEHFVRVDEMRLALVRGDVDKARSLARWLAEHPPHSELPRGWEPYFEMMRSQARKLMEEQTLAEAALDAARVAGTCGSCHIANHAQVHLGAEPEPADHAPLEHHMWAAERLWDSVVSQSDELWSMGASSLGQASVLPPQMKNPPASMAKAKAAFAKLQAAASSARSPNARVEVMGAYLAQCQSCHQQAKAALDAF